MRDLLGKRGQCKPLRSLERTHEDKGGWGEGGGGGPEGRHAREHGSKGTPERTEQRLLVFGLIKWNMKGNSEPGGACLITSL